MRLGQDRLGLDVGAEAGAGRSIERLQAREVERHALTPRSMTVQRRLGACAGAAPAWRAPARAARGTARRRARPRARRRASAPSSTWSWMSSMWNVPPPGRGAAARATTASVSSSTVSRTRAEAAPWPAVDREERLGHRDRDLVRLERRPPRRCGAGSGSPGTPTRPAPGRPAAGRRPERRRSPGRWLLAWMSPLEPWLSVRARAHVCHAPAAARRRSNDSPGQRCRGALAGDARRGNSGYRVGHYIWGLGAQQALPIASNP